MLYSFKKAGGRFCYKEAVPEGLCDEETVVLREAFGRLRRYARWFTNLPAVSALEKIVADLGLAALAGSRPGGDVEVGSLAKAIEILRGLQKEMWTNEQLVDHLAQLVNLEQPHDGISARSGERPVVRLMNLHKVKGLEAPVVFLADPSGEFDHRVQLRIDRSGDRILGHMAVYGPKRAQQVPLLAHPVGWEALAEREGAFVEAEALRLRYVAATRAGSALVVTQRLSPGKSPGRFGPGRHPALEPGKKPMEPVETFCTLLDRGA
jgi:ATP-dependent helicase/nuclease subunit A